MVVVAAAFADVVAIAIIINIVDAAATSAYTVVVTMPIDILRPNLCVLYGIICTAYFLLSNQTERLTGIYFSLPPFLLFRLSVSRSIALFSNRNC